MILLLILYRIGSDNESGSEKVLALPEIIEPPLNIEDEKLNILFWNGFWNWPFFGMGVGNRGFVSNKCKYQNCFTTNQRKKLINKHSRIDAVVTHGWDEDLSKLATKKVSKHDFTKTIY